MKATMKKAFALMITAATLLITALPVSAATKEVPITKVSFPTAATIVAGESRTLSLTVNPTNTTYTTEITWKTTENGTFTKKINGTGTYKKQASSITITGKKSGTGTINASIKVRDSKGKVVRTYTASTKVTVKPAVALKNINLSKTAVTLNTGKSQALTVSYNPTNTTANKAVTWTTSNSKVATVASGKVTAKAPGTATITATVAGKKVTCKVTVKAPLTSLKLSKTSATINAGSSLGLTATYAPANTTDSKSISWSSSNTAVATVSKGTISAKKAGTVNITARMGSKTVTCKVTVKAVAPSFVNVTACYNTLNSYRSGVKAAALRKDANLEKIAQTRAKELVTKFSHTRPNGKSGLTMISGNVYKGENIAMGQTSCASVMTAWYNSTGHRENMLCKNFTKVGIAGYQYNGKIYWVQVFSS